GSFRISSMLLVNSSGFSVTSSTSTRLTRISWPARRAMSPAFFCSTSYTPLPTVPKPRIAMLLINPPRPVQSCRALVMKMEKRPPAVLAALHALMHLDHSALLRQLGQHLLDAHPQGVGAHGDLHLGRAVFRRGLVDGDHAAARGRNAAQKRLQCTVLVQQGGQHRDDLLGAAGIKD